KSLTSRSNNSSNLVPSTFECRNGTQCLTRENCSEIHSACHPPLHLKSCRSKIKPEKFFRGFFHYKLTNKHVRGGGQSQQKTTEKRCLDNGGGESHSTMALGMLRKSDIYMKTNMKKTVGGLTSFTTLADLNKEIQLQEIQECIQEHGICIDKSQLEEDICKIMDGQT
ncbi:Hypothetical predicted protein, partial [Paramuricea clavata]